MDDVRDDFTEGLQQYTENMKMRGDPAFQAGCEAVKQHMYIAVASTLFADLERSRQVFGQTLLQQLPAPPTPLHVESETLPMDERIEKEIDWRRFASSARGDE